MEKSQSKNSKPIQASQGGRGNNIYVALLTEKGEIKYSDPTKIFRIELGSEVRFRLKRGLPISRDAYLLVNKPRYENPGVFHRSASGEMLVVGQEEEEEKQTISISPSLGYGEQVPHYTVTQPRTRMTQMEDQLPSFLDMDQLHAEIMEQRPYQQETDYFYDEIDPRLTYSGSALDASYLDRVAAYNGETSINLEFRVQFPDSGSFFVQIEYQENNQIKYTDPIYINVEPVLLLRNQQIRVKEMSLLTVLSRCMGTIEERWEDMYDNIAQLGYNAIHFAPIQKYGESMSHYSIADQTIIDDCFFKHGQGESLSKEQRFSILKNKVTHLREEYGLLGIVDIVLNHTASNSAWLLEHPEAAYNTVDCPHLMSAYILDKALADFSDDYANRRVPECPSAPYINNEGDIRKVLDVIRDKVFNRLKLHEYFMFNLDATLSKVREMIRTKLCMGGATLESFKKRFDKLGNFSKDPYWLVKEVFTTNLGAEKFQVKLDYLKAAAFFYHKENRNEERAINTLKALLERQNKEWSETIGGYMKEALSNFEGEIKYFKLEQNKKQITPQNRIIKRYFSELPNQQRSCVAHNGWIMNAKAKEDFAMVGWHYLRRTINIWNDSVKLRYGNCPADSPFLWEHMSHYVASLAGVFDGFRLDNAHSTPIHACYYLLQVARSVNPNLFVMAELFTSSAEVDAEYVRKLNINGLIREIQNTYSGKQLGDYYHQITCRESVLGRVDEEFEEIVTGEQYKILQSVRPNDIIYDCTHDNPSPLEKFKTGRIALSHLGVTSMADITIASTWGYDQLIPKNINVVNEKRLYGKFNQDNLFTCDQENPKAHRLNGHLQEEHCSHTNDSNPERTPEEERHAALLKEKKEQEEAEERVRNSQYEQVFEIQRDASRVSVAGDFTQWQKWDMTKDSGNKWVLKHTFQKEDQTRKHQFKFVINDNEWITSKSYPETNDGKGNINNYFEVPGLGQSTHQTQQQVILQPQVPSGPDETVFPDIRYARRKLNKVHEECTRHNSQIFLHQQSDDVLVIIRQFALDHDTAYDSYVSITRHCYFQDGGAYDYQTQIELPGHFAGVVFAGYLEINPGSDYYNVDRERDYINHATAKMHSFKTLNQFCRIETIDSGRRQKLNFFKMPPSFTCVIKTTHPANMKDSIKYFNRLHCARDLAANLFSESTPLSAFNHLLFRCEPEEKEISKGTRGPYGLEKYGCFTYAGISSFMTIFRRLKIQCDMGNELFDNLRNGMWYLEYARDRLGFMRGDGLQGAIDYLNTAIGHIMNLDISLRPKYVGRTIEKLYMAAVYHITQVHMTDHFIRSNSDDLFVQKLALGVVQMYGRVPSAEFYQYKDTMAAGLPHFSTGYTRCWGRDTFIALKGLMITTGLWQETKDIIFQFAKVLRHDGLIPNLHDRGNNTRFNARDATWFFMQAIRDFFYAMIAKDGNTQEAERFLNETVELHFRDQHNRDRHYEMMKRQEPPRKMKLHEIMHSIIQAHAKGISFREWNAGTAIDGEMRDEGFNVNIYLDKNTGFIKGGNKFNCGTWMDKMGSAEFNKGIPATPRDGAPIELTAMLYTSLVFMHDLATQRIIETQGVNLKSDHPGEDGEFWTYKDWAEKIKANFERCYWVPASPSEDGHYSIRGNLVARRGIYKDVVGSQNEFTDYQLRPNLCVAMSYAAELFEPDHARTCLKVVEEALIEKGKCMGVKTLDPKDKNYNGDYINSDASRGWNYHQGPEWLWPFGYFLKAKMTFEMFSYRDELRDEIMSFLVPHQRHIISESRWEGLPELTNSHGKECKDSCTTQAWSIASLLDALKELSNY